MTEATVTLSHVTKRFSPTVTGLDDVTVSFAGNRVTALLGLSGSGKSTLLRHVNGLHRPSSGEVTVLGTRVDTAGKAELRRLRRQIGFIFQHFNLVGPMSVLENVCTGRLGHLRGPRLSLLSYPKQVRRDALEQLDRVGLADRAYQRADTLSGGQQQRVAIARALIQRPKILLADEPVASLDPVSAQQVMELIGRISREEQLTVLCSLHQVQLAMAFSDQIVGLRQGQVVLDRETADIDRGEAFEIYSSVAGEDEDPVPDSSTTGPSTVVGTPEAVVGR
ncbi:phosphonate transport system ATP-binding protein [Propionibacteriaceae bacterium ES.041]|uniref:Phosphonate ABC transporter ATP-binding protein n=1 Tax=Enemella evansiae TaxID=2016499 RepID=A0A255GAC8_9ACTN|nr:phosphonate ABC transporter ATP-binding protein [Enemella evansiae]OYN96263.1 phosphonate ABC transporter ATP-binding protein [Enemella evansiae]OYO12890.1 phosphonate ABC transporter ATP-binding protein [Enemella evansiae]OYO19731.1 phosphonate ABC transporter ATP-binding protein [Enemella evansiae]PFG65491.1 phosphonate transport system ATP-binding protein [Propionibacteriaceae bacterium ES.041]